MSPFRLPVCMLAGFLLLSIPVWAGVNGSVSGLVTDSSGAVVLKAEVTIVDVATNVSTTTFTDSSGTYSFLSLPVGSYTLQVTSPGFERYQQTGIRVNTADALRFNVQLKVGQAAEEVQVAADVVHVETANTQLGDVITGSHIVNMPLNGRDFTDLLGLQAGVVPQISPDAAGQYNYFGSTEQGNVSISGQRESSNAFLINGANVDDPLNNGATAVPDVDSIAEFRVLTANFDAEYGNYGGGIITVITKSGSNAFHGNVFEFLRNTDLDARSYFDISRTAFEQNQFGGTFGGPIRRNKVFFFVDYQGTRNNIGQGTGEVPVPTLAERGGDFSASAASLMTGSVQGAYWASVLSGELGYPVSNGESYYTQGCTTSSECVFPNGKIPTTAFSAPATALLNYIPQPNVGNDLFASSANTINTRDDLGSGRIDVNSQSWGTISGYYFIDDQSIVTPFGNNNVPGFPTTNGGRSQLFTLGITKALSAASLNEFHLALNRHIYHNGLPLSGFGSLSSFGFNENQPGGIYPAAGPLSGVPTISLNNFQIGLPDVAYVRYETSPSVSDNFARTWGKHTLKFGGQYIFTDFHEPMNLVLGNGLFAFYGTETGIDFADFLIGAPSSLSQEAGFNVDNRHNYAGTFAQDSWHARPNLTLNFGLRWDVLQPWYEKDDQTSTLVAGVQSTVHPEAPTGYLFPGDTVPGYGKIPRTISRTSYDHFVPRLGFAWSPSTSGFLSKLLGGSDKFSVRGGFGIFYNNIEGAQVLTQTGLAPFDTFYYAPLPPLFVSPYTNRLDGGIHQPFPFSTQNYDWSLELPLGGYAVPPINQRIPYTETYNLTLQRQFLSNTLMTVSYVGNQDHHLLAQIANNPGNAALCMSLSQPSEVAPGTQTCGPNLESAVFTRASGTVVNGTRGPFGPNFVENTWFATASNSAYNALQVSLRHDTKTLSVVVGYTYSKAMDNTSAINGREPNPVDPAISRGLSSFDITHNFVVSYSYLLPFDKLAGDHWRSLTSDWQLVGITHFSTGFPIGLYESDDHSLLGNAGSADTPDFLGGSLNFQNPRKANANTGVPYFNTALFVPSAIGSEGTSNRAFFHGPGTNNFDMSLLKHVKLGEQRSLEFRFEFFNVFNHAQFLNPGNTNVDAGPTSFGIINAAGPGRIGQVAIKFAF